MASSLDFDGGLTCAMETTDLDRSVAWYQDVLGFELLYRMDDIGWCELKTAVPGVNIGLSQVESPQVKGGVTPTFGVRDIDRARAELEAKGVRFDGETITIQDMVRLATVYDPDGNKLMFYQDLKAEG